ncbi:hypothetical protein D3C77_700730 [compost metagenome]
MIVLAGGPADRFPHMGFQQIAAQGRLTVVQLNQRRLDSQAHGAAVWRNLDFVQHRLFHRGQNVQLSGYWPFHLDIRFNLGAGLRRWDRVKVVITHEK